MGYLDKEDLDKIESYLDQQGLAFQPLRNEIMDHFIEDLEEHMRQGNSFNEAWDLIIDNIPDNHFKTLQNETMETINKRFSLSQGFTYVSLILLLATSIFKLLHFPLSDILLLASFGTIAAALLTGTLSGITLYKEKKGNIMLLGAVISIILFLISFGFQALHLPGFTGLRTISIISLIIFFPGLTIYFGIRKKNEETILTYLHKKHSLGIERYLIILLLLSVTLKILLIAFGYTPNVSHVLLVLVIGGSALQYFALNWHYYNQNWWFSAALVLGFLCFILPSQSSVQFSQEVSIVLELAFYLIAGLIVVARSNETLNKKALISFLTIVLAVLVLRSLIRLNILDTFLNASIFNLPILILLFAGLVLFIKHPLVKVYMFIVIANYMLYV